MSSENSRAGSASANAGRIARNSGASVVFLAAQLVAGLFAVPIALNALGAERFGLVSLVTGLALLLQVANLGLGIGLARFAGAYAIDRDSEQLQAFTSDAYVVAVVGNIVVGIGVLTLGLFGQNLLHIDAGDRVAFRDVALIIAVTAPINGVLSVPRGLLAGLQLTGLRTRRDLIGAVGPLLAAIAVSQTVASVTLYTVILQGCAVLGGVAVLHATGQVLPWLKHRPARTRGTFRRFFAFTGLQVLNQVADIIFLTTDRIVLQAVSGPIAVAEYTVTERLQKLADALVSVPLSALIPASAQAWTASDRQLIDKMVHRGTRLYLAAVLPPIAALIGLMGPFLDLWVGQQYRDLTLAAQLFVLSLAVPAVVRVFTHVLLGKGRQRETVISKLVYAPLNLALSILLASRYGVIGVIIPTTAYYVIVFPSVQLALMGAEGFSVRRFCRDVFPFVLVAALSVVCAATLTPRAASDSWLVFFACAMTATLAGYGVVVALLRPMERALAKSLVSRRTIVT